MNNFVLNSNTLYGV